MEFRAVCAIEFTRFAFDQLQMNVERVERIADFMRNPGSEQSQRVQPLRLDRLLFAASSFSDVAQNNRVSYLLT